MTSFIPPSPSNPDRSNPADLPAVASAVDRLTGEVARLRDDLQPLRAVPLRLGHLERAVTADSSAAPAWAAGVERGLDELAGTVRGALAEMAAAVDSSLTVLAESLRSRPLASPRRADPGASGVPAASVATVLEAAERIVGREIGELRDDLADALEEVLGQVSAQLTATSEELRSTLADLAGPANPTGSAGPRSVADPVVPRPAAGRAGAPEEYAVEAPRRDQPDQDASAGVRRVR